MSRSRGRCNISKNDVHLNGALLPRNNGQINTSSSSDLSIPRLVPLDPEQFDDCEDDCNSTLVPISVEDLLSDSTTNLQLEELNENAESLKLKEESLKENVDSSKENLNHDQIKATNLWSDDNLELNRLCFENSPKEDIYNPFVQFKNKLRIFETTRRESFITSVTNFFNHTETTSTLMSYVF